MEFDGQSASCSLPGAPGGRCKGHRLELPVRRHGRISWASVARAGCGLRRGRGNGTGPILYDSFWIGDVPAGFGSEFRGGYAAPDQSLSSRSARLVEQRRGRQHALGKGEIVLLRAYCGHRRIEAATRYVRVALLLTPVKPLDTAAHSRAHQTPPLESSRTRKWACKWGYWRRPRPRTPRSSYASAPPAVKSPSAAASPSAWRQALVTGGLKLHYQPLVSLQSGFIRGAEAIKQGPNRRSVTT